MPYIGLVASRRRGAGVLNELAQARPDLARIAPGPGAQPGRAGHRRPDRRPRSRCPSWRRWCPPGRIRPRPTSLRTATSVRPRAADVAAAGRATASDDGDRPRLRDDGRRRRDQPAPGPRRNPVLLLRSRLPAGVLGDPGTGSSRQRRRRTPAGSSDDRPSASRSSPPTGEPAGRPVRDRPRRHRAARHARDVPATWPTTAWRPPCSAPCGWASRSCWRARPASARPSAAKSLAAGAGHPADPAAVLRGHRHRRGRLRVELPAPVAGDPAGRGRGRRARRRRPVPPRLPGRAAAAPRRRASRATARRSC